MNSLTGQKKSTSNFSEEETLNCQRPTKRTSLMKTMFQMEELIGDLLERSMLSRTKVNAAHAGHSQLLAQWRLHTLLRQESFSGFLSRKLLIVHTPTTMVAKVVCSTEPGAMSRHSEA